MDVVELDDPAVVGGDAGEGAGLPVLTGPSEVTAEVDGECGGGVVGGLVGGGLVGAVVGGG